VRSPVISKAGHLDQPINIHLTGCPNSCAQHHVGDIGLQGVKANFNSASVEAYHVVFGGGTGANAASAGRCSGHSFGEIPRCSSALRVHLAPGPQQSFRELHASLRGQGVARQFSE
jgi:ferredoxin-nitrite reductase